MLIKHIKQSIKNRHANNGNKNLRNNYRIGVTNQHRNIIANRKFKLEVRDSKKDLSIPLEVRDIIIKEWTARGYKKTDLTRIGILKALEILK
jgi:hypothetical protein